MHATDTATVAPSPVYVFINDTKTSGLKIHEPALFLRDSWRLFEEATEFLREHYVKTGGRSSPDTWATAAYSLASWFDYLAAVGVTDWRLASKDDVTAYRESYEEAISPKTGMAYAGGTIGNRISTISAFYKYAGEVRWYEGDILAEISEDAPESRDLDSDELAHTRHKRRVRIVSKLAPRRRPNRRLVRPLFDVELRAFLPELGPRPSERPSGDLRPCRDRLLGDLGIFVGLRNDEIHQLTTYQFLSMHPDPNAPVAEQSLTVIGKGRKPRSVAIPNWLVLDALAYIEGERAAMMSIARRKKRKLSAQLLVAGSDSNSPGRPLTHRRLQQIVEEACIRAGIVEIVERTDPDTNEIIAVKKAKHCVHDLRHTYTVLTYHAEKALGNENPWKKIQAQLGHENVTTTINIYGKHVEIFGKRQKLFDVRKLIGL